MYDTIRTVRYIVVTKFVLYTVHSCNQYIFVIAFVYISIQNIYSKAAQPLQDCN